MFTRTALVVSLLIAALLSPALAQNFELSMSKADIEIAQVGLTEIGWLKVLPTGKIDPKTRDAITSWRENRKVSVDGPLTSEEFDLLKKVDPKTLAFQWVAVAAAVDGPPRVLWDQKSGIAAMRSVMKTCRSRSSKPATCTLAAGYVDHDGPFPVGATRCKRRIGSQTLTQIMVSVRKDADTIRQGILDKLEELGFQASQCQELIMIDGAGVEY